MESRRYEIDHASKDEWYRFDHEEVWSDHGANNIYKTTEVYAAPHGRQTGSLASGDVFHVLELVAEIEVDDGREYWEGTDHVLELVAEIEVDDGLQDKETEEHDETWCWSRRLARTTLHATELSDEERRLLEGGPAADRAETAATAPSAPVTDQPVEPVAAPAAEKATASATEPLAPAADKPAEPVAVPAAEEAKAAPEPSAPAADRRAEPGPANDGLGNSLSSMWRGPDWAALHKRLFRHNCVDVINKYHSRSASDSLRQTIERYITNANRRKVFISHSTQDGSVKVFTTLLSILQTSYPHVEVFNPTEAFAQEDASKELMAKKAAEADVVFACISPKFFESRWCHAEVAGAVAADTDIVPLFAGEEFSGAVVEKWIKGDYGAKS